MNDVFAEDYAAIAIVLTNYTWKKIHEGLTLVSPTRRGSGTYYLLPTTYYLGLLEDDGNVDRGLEIRYRPLPNKQGTGVASATSYATMLYCSIHAIIGLNLHGSECCQAGNEITNYTYLVERSMPACKSAFRPSVRHPFCTCVCVCVCVCARQSTTGGW
jgi:hypothetical protein